MSLLTEYPCCNCGEEKKIVLDVIVNSYDLFCNPVIVS